MPEEASSTAWSRTSRAAALAAPGRVVTCCFSRRPPATSSRRSPTREDGRPGLCPCAAWRTACAGTPRLEPRAARSTGRAAVARAPAARRGVRMDRPRGPRAVRGVGASRESCELEKRVAQRHRACASGQRAAAGAARGCVRNPRRRLQPVARAQRTGVEGAGAPLCGHAGRDANTDVPRPAGTRSRLRRLTRRMARVYASGR